MSDNNTFWANFNDGTKNGTRNRTHTVNCFFYIKGSRDYPVGQNLNENFGFDLNSDGTISETPVFSNSIKDVYSSKSNLLEVFNNYSFDAGDNNNGIASETDERYNFFSNDLLGNQRDNGNPDYISTLLIDTSNLTDSEKELFKHIDPNFSLSPTSSELTVGEYIDEINKLLTPGARATSSGETATNYATRVAESAKLRFNIFWKEMFRCLERLKHYEQEIYLKYNQQNLPDDAKDHFLTSSDNPWFDNSNGPIDENSKISFLRIFSNVNTWLWFAYPYTDTNITIGDTTNKLAYKPDYYVNPFRLALSSNQNNDLTSTQLYDANFLSKQLTEVASSDSTYQRYLEQIKDQLAGTQWLPENNGGSNVKTITGIKMQMVPNYATTDGSNAITTISDVSSRLKKFTFTIKYVSDTIVNDNGVSSDVYDIWTFNVYFDPEDFIKSEDSSTTTFPVWTFNESDIDEVMRRSFGTVPTPGLNDEGIVAYDSYNYLDNDYANTLVPNTTETQYVRNHFVASKDEIDKQFISELIKKVKDGGYENYVKLTVNRVTPVVYNENGYDTILWDLSKYTSEERIAMFSYDINNVTTQDFYVFYKGSVVPSNAQQRQAVQQYLRNLHSNCNPTLRDENNSILTIGHGSGSEDITNFLSEMYPDLFTKSQIYIIPTRYDFCRDSSTKMNAKQYFNTITPERMVQSIRAITTIDLFKNFVLDEQGVNNQIINSSDSNKVKLPAEAFYIGSVAAYNTSNDVEFQYPMPWYAVSRSINTINCLTAITGFDDYCPRTFTSADNFDSVTPGDMFQLIMIKLTQKMFDNPSDKAKITKIGGIELEYECDNSYWSGAKDGDVLKYNVAKFEYKGVSFIVYAQMEKYFCDNQSTTTEITSIS